MTYAVTRMDRENNSEIVDGVVLLNACTNCGNKFRPIRSMMYETLCNLCKNKK